ncbi:bacteriophage abortive infection AbiH family protein [Haloplasma contractile]|uniref:Abortive phage resistance mechanism Lactococcus lacti protein n=1 Tax=Haloplasma contractile SSD-17B TaxID=1033810 RepID=F7PVU1_9MOLU|nr:bacteriophage abortive infection AbiH family protein [Haloplasma contractile]ERJ12737.1 abortive phage resistance mechanism Lactococcus lacti protein [Haloplasma contractile SSD-17B]
MKRLFIIGNGFDLAHKLPTSYEDFHAYLYEQYQATGGSVYTAPGGSVSNHGETIYDDGEVADFLVDVINRTEGEEWKDFENTLGYLDFSDYLYDLVEVYDDEDDIDYRKTMNNIEDTANDIFEAVNKIHEYFEEWINSIVITEEIQKNILFENLLKDSDNSFMTFNYTKTLEKLYDINNVFHVHGVQGTKIIVGHGSESDYEEYITLDGIGFDIPLEDLHNTLRKDTKKIIYENIIYFRNLLRDINEIYSFGFSFSNVDLIYIKEICECVDTSRIKWYLNDFDDISMRTNFKNKIRGCGFKGKFDTYSTAIKK